MRRLSHVMALVTVAITGCQLGPAAVRIGHAEYNEAIQSAAAEQLLLNLVRLKYRESPLVLDVGSVSAQFEIAHGFGASGTLNENVGQAVSSASRQFVTGAGGVTGTANNSVGRISGRNPDSLGLSGQFSYAERPTVTYVPLQGEDFVQRMLTPIGLTTLVKLVNSGWRIDRVLSLTVQELNGLDNLGAASGPTPDVAPEYATFLEAAELMRALQLQRAIWFDYESKAQELSEPLPIEMIGPDAVLHAVSSQAHFRLRPDGAHAVLTRMVERPYLRLAENERSAEKIARLRELLHLSNDRDRYELVPARTPAAEPDSEDGRMDRIVVDTRSLLGVMFYLSQSVEAPDSHVRAGLVTQTMDERGLSFDWSEALKHLMTIHVGMFPPPNRFLAVHRRGYWYYIRDDDLNTKSTFILLAQLFSLRAGAGTGSGPVLTLPVGG